MDLEAVGIAVVAGAVLLIGELVVRFATRPVVKLAPDDGRLWSRIEATSGVYVRILARNGRFRRRAKGARVFVESYRQRGAPLSHRVTLGGPAVLGWPSAVDAAADGSLTIAPGMTRAVDFGALVTEPSLAWVNDMTSERPPYIMQLLLHNLRLTDGRDQLRNGGHWTVCLVTSADGAASRKYDVHVFWNETARTHEDVLNSVSVTIEDAAS